MFKPVSFFIGLRYTRAKSRNQFISLISWISILGIALGVAVLITVLSVVNGFDREIKRQIFGMIPPITVNSYFGSLDNWQTLESSLKSFPQVSATAPFVSGQTILSNGDKTLPAMLIGIVPHKEKTVSALSEKIIQGNLENLMPGKFGIIIGKELAKKLNLALGDNIIIATIQNSFSAEHASPHFKKFNVLGIFQAGGGALSFDSKLAFINLQDAQQFFSLGQDISGLHVNIRDIYTAPLITETMQNRLPSNLTIWNWTNQLGDFFENIRMTKTMMFFIFVLIITVAAFNLISMMVMVVKNKERDIAILRTLGATPVMVLKIFLVQGILIAFGGTLLGTLGGLALAYNITAISKWIQTTLHVQLVSSNVYFVNYLPSEIQWHDVWFISIVALGLSLIATLYPAWNASRVEPVEALNQD
jgi:lipoprotein-releasing system permease protein